MIASVIDLQTTIENPALKSYGIASHQPVAAPLPEDENPASPRRFISWLDLYPPEEVETIGRERLLSAPAPRVEELSDGSVLVVSKHPLSDDPIDDIAEHMGIHFWGDDPEFVP